MISPLTLLSTGDIMNSAQNRMRRKRASETGTLIGVRLQARALRRLDRWVETQGDAPTRPEAIRRLMEAALGGCGVGGSCVRSV